MSQNDLVACFVGTGVQAQGETFWVSTVSDDSSLLGMDEVPLGMHNISKASLVNA